MAVALVVRLSAALPVLGDPAERLEATEVRDLLLDLAGIPVRTRSLS